MDFTSSHNWFWQNIWPYANWQERMAWKQAKLLQLNNKHYKAAFSHLVFKAYFLEG